MNYCEASFAKKSNTIGCGESSTKIAKWIQDEQQFIYYFCDLHTEILKQAEPGLQVEEYIREGKKDIHKYAI